MCTCFTVRVNWLPHPFGKDLWGIEPDFVPRWNIKPGHLVRVLRTDGSEVVSTHMVWGLIPYWTKLEAGATIPKPSYSTFNAVGETLDQRPAYRHTLRAQRGIIVFDGFYEPKGPKTLKQRDPYFFHRPDDAPMTAAALWDVWRSKDSTHEVVSCTLVTLAGAGLVGTIHDRMPAILPPERVMAWLDSRNTDWKSVLADLPEPPLETYEVSRYLYQRGAEGPDCVAPFTGAAH
jgi:putative SOS response-associated peptidase YedK